MNKFNCSDYIFWTSAKRHFRKKLPNCGGVWNLSGNGVVEKSLTSVGIRINNGHSYRQAMNSIDCCFQKKALRGFHI